MHGAVVLGGIMKISVPAGSPMKDGQWKKESGRFFMEITIAPELTQVVPKASLLVLDYQAEVTFSSPALQAKFIKLGAKQAARLDLPAIAQMPQIAATRAAYRALGKAQASYRNTAEAMLRRLVKGKELDQINNVVEINNLMSIFSGFSIGSYNLAALSGPITWRPAPAGATYAVIGKGQINIAALPTLFDAVGPFGNPTIDSRRAAVNFSTAIQPLMSVVYSFSGAEPLPAMATIYARLLRENIGVTSVKARVITAAGSTPV